ncbi:MAG: DUF2920 family protein [Deltaproteobacteria bacterium]|nr:DUF2920 family protein [Deltaproteobacteria bacterium]
MNENTIPILALHGHGEMGQSAYLKSLHESVSQKLNALVISVEYLGLKLLRSGNPTHILLDEWSLKETNYNLRLQGMPPISRNVLKEKNPLQVLIQLLKSLPLKLNSPLRPIPCISARFLDDHYDFGVVQTLDCLWAVKVAMDLHPNIDWSRLSAAGLSHGGYLATQCARFAPNTFSLIVNGYGWVKPYLPWMLREDNGHHKELGGISFVTFIDNYWRLEADHPFFLSPGRLQIRTQNSQDQLSQWKQQQEGSGPLFIMTQQINDERHPRAEKEELILQMNVAGFNLKSYLNPPENTPYRSLLQGDKTSFKGLIYDFITAENLQPTRIIKSDFDRKSVISYRCRNIQYEIDYTEGLPRLKTYQV